MKVQELSDILLRHGFEKEKLDSGFNYTKTDGHIQLICYIEPQIDIAFMTIYAWNDNEIKGIYKASLLEISRAQDSASLFFRQAVEDMPKFIGDKVDVHKEMNKAIDDTFK